MRHWFRHTDNEEGATLLFVALLLVALLGLSSLAVDVGLWLNTRSEAQRVADAAALAGAGEFMIAGTPKATAERTAREFAARNYVGRSMVDTAAAAGDVVVEVDMGLQRVRVTVRGRTTPLFASFLGFSQLDVTARAAARVLQSGGADCVKPWALPDIWKETESDVNGNNVFDDGESWNYDPTKDYYERWSEPETSTMTGYGSDLRKDVNRDQGRQLKVKATDPNDPTAPGLNPGQFYPWDMPGSGSGASDYRTNIATCHDSTIVLGRSYPIKTGNMVGPTNQGVKDLIAQDPTAYWDQSTNQVVSQYGDKSPRIIKVALWDPSEIAKSGKQYIKFNNIALLFIEEQKTQKDPVVARFIKYADGVSSTGPNTGSLVRVLQLIE